MKQSLTTLVASAILFSQSIQADINTDAEQIFNDAQQVYANFFPSNQATQIFEPWIFRFYPQSEIYLGVNKEDLKVYLLGGVFGSSPTEVGSIEQILSLLSAQKGTSTDSSTVCDLASIPEGMIYQQDGNTITLSTNGQCIKVPDIASKNYCDVNPSTDSSGAPIATGIHALITSNVQDYQLTGLLIDIPSLGASIANTANTKTCLINAPTGFTSYNVNIDLCLDITDQLTGTPEIMAFINPPVTLNYTGSSSTTIVNDCFATDAVAISDAVTGEVWTNVNGTFTKIN